MRSAGLVLLAALAMLTGPGVRGDPGEVPSAGRGDCRADLTSGIPMRTRSREGLRFQDVLDDLDFAISEHNFRITGRNNIGQGLRERGYAGYPDYEVIHFCNLENARTVLDLDPGFVAQMPCRVTVHTEGSTVVVTMLLLPERHPLAAVQDFARALNRELCAIQDYALP